MRKTKPSIHQKMRRTTQREAVTHEKIKKEGLQTMLIHPQNKVTEIRRKLLERVAVFPEVTRKSKKPKMFGHQRGMRKIKELIKIKELMIVLQIGEIRVRAGCGEHGKVLLNWKKC
jgi:hypothetical protein